MGKIVSFACGVFLLLSAPALAQKTKFLPVSMVTENTAWSSGTCNTPARVQGSSTSYSYLPCQDNGTWSAGDFAMRFLDYVPGGLSTFHVHPKVVFETGYGTGVGSTNGMTFSVSDRVYDAACSICSGGGCVAGCQIQHTPGVTYYDADATNAYSVGRCVGGTNDDTTCTADSTCTGGGICVTRVQWTTNDSDPLLLQEASDDDACTAGSCAGRPVMYTVEILKTGGGFTLDRDFRILGLLIEYDCPTTGSGGTACPDSL